MRTVSSRLQIPGGGRYGAEYRRHVQSELTMETHTADDDGSSPTELVTDSEDVAESTGWWSRPCGVREVLVVAVPLVLSTLSWTVMSFIDRTFLTWYDSDAMAAAMPAGTISFAAICLPMGIASYVGTFVAQYNGAKQYSKIGHIIWQGVWIGVGFLPIFLLLLSVAPWLFRHVGHTETLAELETLYFQALMYGAAGVVVNSSLSGFFSGRQETVVVMYVSAVSALINIALDYVWIFGYFGFPEAGIVGAGLATSLSEWIKALIYLSLIFRRDASGQFGIVRGMRVSGPSLRRLFWFGGPNGLQFFIEMSAFSAYLLLVGQLGEKELAATSLAFNVNQLAFVPMLGLGMAVSIMVGNQIGQHRVDLASRATWTTLSITVIYSLVMAALYFIFPGAFLFFHEMGADQAEFSEVRDITVVLLRFVAIYCLFDAILIVFSSAIKGAGDTQFVLLASVILSPIPVVLGWVGIEYWSWGLEEFWYLVTFWILAQALVYCVRFWQGKWRTMRVIEH